MIAAASGESVDWKWSFSLNLVMTSPRIDPTCPCSDLQTVSEALQKKKPVSEALQQKKPVSDPLQKKKKPVRESF